jgi:Thioredoxin
MMAVLLAVLSLAAPRGAAPDYSGFYDKGVPFARFLADAKSLKSEWDANFAGATIEDVSLARAKALKGSWRILVVAEDSCHDSLYTVPYLAKLVGASPDTLSMRIVRKAVGLPVMEAHRTPDGRPATPTIVVLDSEGGVKGAIAERPAALWEFSKEHSGRGERRQWYAEDKGRHAIAEILDLIEK